MPVDDQMVDAARQLRGPWVGAPAGDLEARFESDRQFEADRQDDSHVDVAGDDDSCAVCGGELDWDDIEAGDDMAMQFSNDDGDVVGAHGACGDDRGWRLA